MPPCPISNYSFSLLVRLRQAVGPMCAKHAAAAAKRLSLAPRPSPWCMPKDAIHAAGNLRGKLA